MGAYHFLAFAGNKISANKGPKFYDLWIAGLNIAAGDIQITTDGHQIDQSPCCIEGMDIMFDGISPLDNSGICFGIPPSRLPDEIGGHLCDFGHLFRRIFFHMLRQVAETIGPFLNKVPVIQRFFNYNIYETQSQDVIGSGS